jgi:hypothetical protein
MDALPKDAKMTHSEKVRENALRRMAQRRGLRLERSRRRDPAATDFGTYRIVSPRLWREVEGGDALPSLDAVSAWLVADAKRELVIVPRVYWNVTLANVTLGGWSERAELTDGVYLEDVQLAVSLPVGVSPEDIDWGSLLTVDEAEFGEAEREEEEAPAPAPVQ